MAELEPTTPAPGQEPEAKVEATEVVETPAEPTEVVEELSVEALREIARKANAQAAAERVKRQEALTRAEELEARLAETQSPEESAALVAEYKGQIAQSNRDADRYRAALATGLPEIMVDRIQGDDFDAMLADAQSLAELVVKPAPQDPRIPGGGRAPTQDAAADEPGSLYRAAKRKHSF